MTLRILILGGYGTFGGRLVRLLADEPRLTLMVAGRSLAKAEVFCAEVHASAHLVARVFDRRGDVERQLKLTAPDIVVDASGPFQAYGDTYRVVRAALALGVNYLDLADGSDFVEGIAQFDPEAQTRGVFMLSGVSSFPVLTAAVVRLLAQKMSRVEKVTGGIAPSPYADVGLNVIRAIASYTGKPIDIPRAGKHFALIETRRFTIAPPGRLPLRPILFSLVDVPDLKVLPALWPTLKSGWMGAGPVPAILHRALIALAWLVRAGILRSAAPFAPLMFRAINVLRWGEHRGGMFVKAEGTALDGAPLERSWHMIAEGDDGPLIPSMAAEAIIRRCLDGRRPASGARPAVNELEMIDYDVLFARRKIFAGIRDALPEEAPLYRRILGESWARLPPELKEMHNFAGELSAQGRASVERGAGWLARSIAAIFRFPAAGADVPVSVTFRSDHGREIWRRTFDGRSFVSVQQEGRGRYERLLRERFGPLAFGLALVWEQERLKLVPRGWSFLGIPLPSWLMPGGEAFEWSKDGRFHFHVEIGQRLTGLIVRYRGWLAPIA